MSFRRIPLVNVYLMQGDQKQSVGRLASKDHQIYFEYTPAFIQTGIELSPFKLPLKAGVIPANDRVFGGLFSVFNDSLPDGWGRLLLDRKVAKLGLHPSSLSPLERLCYVADQGMGALCYEPAIESSFLLPHRDLDQLAEEVRQVEANNDQFIDELLAFSGSSAGARPKVIVNINEADWTAISEELKKLIK